MGYKMYVDLVQPLLSGQEVIATGMMGELQRCQLAIDRALAGAKVALVSSGDVGIYGMAGLALEICQERGLRLGPLQRRAGGGSAFGGYPRCTGPGRGRGAVGGPPDA